MSSAFHKAVTNGGEEGTGGKLVGGGGTVRCLTSFTLGDLINLFPSTNPISVLESFASHVFFTIGHSA